MAAVGVAVCLLVWRPVVDRTGWAPGWTLAAMSLGAGTLALTLLPGAADGPRGVRSCVRAAASGEGLLDNTSAADAALNLLLLVPLGFAVVLSTRRVSLGAAAVLVLPGGIELAQTRVSGRVCSGADYVTNVVGGLAGVAAAGGVLGIAWALRRSREARP